MLLVHVIIAIKKNLPNQQLEEVINFQQEIIKIVLDSLKEEKASEKTT